MLPPHDASYLTEWLFEIGPTVQDGPIRWQDMTSWSQVTGVDLTPWEARTLRRLSRAWINQCHDARKPNCLEPRTEHSEIVTTNRVDAQFAAMISALRAGS